jgi:1-acyl-sn-glycerol-3-phosphate acyltransferase
LIRFAPELPWEKLLFAVSGRRQFAAATRKLSHAPLGLEARGRAELQRRLGRQLIEHLRVQLRIEGLEHLPRTRHVVIALHEGIADALCLTQLPLTMRFVVRDEIFTWPRIGPSIRRMQHIAINPERGAASYRLLLRDLPSMLEAGEHVVIFPQGTLLGIETAFQAGAFRLARWLRLPVLPIVLTGTHRIWEHPFSGRLRYRQPVAMVVLAPVSADEVASRSAAQLRLELQRRMKLVALSGQLPPPRRYVPGRDGYWDGFAFDIDPEFPVVYQDVDAHRRMRFRRQERSCASGEGIAFESKGNPTTTG